MLRLTSAFALAACLTLMSVSAQIPNNVTFTQFTTLTFARPVHFGEIPGKPGAYIVLEQRVGVVFVTRNSGGQWVRSTFLAMSVQTSPNEMGLLGIAFHPNFAQNRKYYLNYNPSGTALATVVEERLASNDMTRDSGVAARQILRITQPNNNHNGGTLAFGTDGFLYIGMGDGGGSNDPNGAGQNRNTLLGKILRINVDAPNGSVPYSIPSDNPFVGQAGMLGEIWAYGLRNPWKWSFDPLSGKMWVGEVGQGAMEEIDTVKKGDNLGWNVMEGSACRVSGCATPNPYTPPVYAYANLGMNNDNCIIGGHIFRGNAASPFYGVYFFADNGSRRVWGLKTGTGAPTVQLLGTLAGSPSSFGTDAQGNIYILGLNNGVIYQLTSPDMATAVSWREAPENRAGNSFSIKAGARLILPGLQDATWLSLYDSQGRLLRSYSGKAAEWVANLNPGLYFFKTNLDRGTGAHTLLVK